MSEDTKPVRTVAGRVISDKMDKSARIEHVLRCQERIELQDCETARLLKELGRLHDTNNVRLRMDVEEHVFDPLKA